jgi:hypothetical protein
MISLILLYNINKLFIGKKKKSSSFLPKYTIDTKDNEIAKIVKATDRNRIELISVAYSKPTKTLSFEKMYPPTH